MIKGFAKFCLECSEVALKLKRLETNRINTVINIC